MEPVSSFQERFSELVGDQTCQSVGVLLGISKATVSAYMTGVRSPKKPVLLHIASVYNVDPVWLMGYDVPKYKETPNLSEGGLNEDQQFLIDKILHADKAELQALRAIVEQVLALRDT